MRKLKLEDFNPDDWDKYFNDTMQAVENLTSIVLTFQSEGATMSVASLVELRSELSTAAYEVSECLVILSRCIPYWDIRYDKAKLEAKAQAVKEAGSVTFAKETIDAFEPAASVSLTRGIIKDTVSTVKTTLSAAENVSHSIAGKIRGDDSWGIGHKDDNNNGGRTVRW